MGSGDNSLGYMGLDALNLVFEFPHLFPSVRRFYFKSYSPEPGVEERLDLSDVRTLGAASMTQLLKHQADPTRLIAQMLRGINANETANVIELESDKLRSGLDDLKRSCDLRGDVLAIYSCCTTDTGATRHIPMMDFRIEAEGELGQIPLLRQALNQLGEDHGVLLNSGKSFHYYGLRLLQAEDWRRFMSAALLLDPLVDVRYIAHRLLAAKAALRIIPNTGRKPTMPRVVAQVGG